MKMVRRWICVVLLGLSIAVPVIVNVTSLHESAFADEALTEGDVNAIKQNVLYKAVYSNLQKCYNNMQPQIDETEDNVWANFNSATYFKEAALASNFLKFPFDVGKRNESSCPKMITGWHNNWFIDLFRGEGNYSGVLQLNANAEVPDNSYDSSPTKMGNFLKNIGYNQEQETTEIDGRKCFYFKFKIEDSIYETYGLPKPAGNGYFETLDFCAKVDSGGNLIQSEDAIVALTGNNQYFGDGYDNGHLTDNSNFVMLYFATPNSYTPQFQSTDYSGVDWANKNFLQTNFDGTIGLYYNYNVELGFAEPQWLSIKRIREEAQAESSSECSSRGYEWCGSYDKGIFSSRVFIGSLITPGTSISYSTFKSRLKNVLEHAETNDGYRIFGTISTIEYTPKDTSYVKGYTNTKFMNYFLGDTSSFDGGRFSDAEKYILYYTYLKESYNVATAANSVEDGVQVSWLKSDGTFEKVYVYDPDANLNDKKYVPELSAWLNLVELNWKEIAERMAQIDVASAFSEVGITDPVLDPNLPPVEPEADVSSISACYENAGALGWIACPILEVVGGVTEQLYGFIESNFLLIDADLSNSDGVRVGWGIFRDFTNIIFVILFLVVIFSQVTGIGVSNYGIKKILPRLIMVVALVNVSFVLCQIAVDLSNIAGASLRGLFEGFAADAAAGSGGVPFDFGAVLGGIIGGAFIAGAAAKVTAVFAITIPWNIWLFPIILAVIGCVISVFFFLILLGVRQAGVVILMILSPVAIICYALPNTKPIFDRWRKLFTSLLLVYPICGLLMGGGQFASTLLLIASHEGDGGAFFTIVAMLVSVVPFFFIPSILKSSMMAMGNLGMKISQFGHGISGGITRGIRGSEIGRDIQRQQQMKYNLRSARKLLNKKKQIEAQNGKFKDGYNRRLQRAVSAHNRARYEDIRAGGTQELLEPDSAQATSMEENVRAEQFEKDVTGRQNLIKSGSFDSIVTPGDKVSGNDDAALGAELDKYLEGIIDPGAQGLNDEQVNEYVKNAQAIINTLSDRGTSGARAKVVNSISGAMNANATKLMGATGDEKQRLTRTFGSLASRISAKYGKIYKGDFPGAATMFSDIAKGDFSAASTFRVAKDYDIDGNVTGSHLRSTQYSSAGLDGINIEDFSKLKTSGLSNILAGIQDGDITGEKLQEVARLADGVLNSDIYTPEGDARKYMERIRDAAFASSAVDSGSGRTMGSSVISRADSRAIGSILDQVQAAGDWSTLGTDQQGRYAQLMSNIHESLSSDAFTTQDAGQLKEVLKVARSKNFEDATHTRVSEFTGSTTIKVPHGAGGNVKQKVSLPAGWARNPSGQWIEVTSSGMRPLTVAEVKKAEQIEAHNNQVDIDNGTV